MYYPSVCFADAQQPASLVRGATVATATAWYTERDHEQIGVVHGFSCHPAYQSKGFGKIAAAYMMDCYHRLMPGCPVWLDTQIWSYRAIGIYMELGFVRGKTADCHEKIKGALRNVY